ncbi:hypothetical protein AB1Y20_004997 [Prymnesium parvum]|uniref:DDE Tnp4 domain-containing protein n=1 Tax=Prymnesium parvum TaxID=97485 RepID=A0AB34J5A2_PRYPA
MSEDGEAPDCCSNGCTAEDVMRSKHELERSVIFARDSYLPDIVARIAEEMRGVVLRAAPLDANVLPLGSFRWHEGWCKDVILDAMECMLWTGMPYRALERVQLQYNFRTVNAHIVRWARSGAFQEAYRRAMRLQRRPARRGATHNALDTTYVKSMYGRDQVDRNPTDRGRRATKVSALVDEDGVVHSLAFFAGNVADCNTVDATLQTALAGFIGPSRLLRATWTAGFSSSVSPSVRSRRFHRSISSFKGDLDGRFQLVGFTLGPLSPVSSVHLVF